MTGLAAPLPISAGIDNLRAEFDRQEAQLGVLENLLLDRKVDNALLPSGMPVAQGYIASGYGERSDPINGHQAVHLGIDFDAPIGTPVMAVAEGVVSFVGPKPGYGNVVEIDHGNGYMTRYAHNSSLVAELGHARARRRHDRQGRLDRPRDRAALPFRGLAERAAGESDRLREVETRFEGLIPAAARQLSRLPRRRPGSVAAFGSRPAPG